jgi:hypothetical protein
LKEFLKQNNIQIHTSIVAIGEAGIKANEPTQMRLQMNVV